jgi:hypothetical protein
LVTAPRLAVNAAPASAVLESFRNSRRDGIEASFCGKWFAKVFSFN